MPLTVSLRPQSVPPPVNMFLYIVVTYSRYHHSCCEGHVHGVRACSRHTTNRQFTGCFSVRSPPSLLRCGCGVLGAVCVCVQSVCPL